MKALKTIIAAIALFYIPTQTMAWGTNGHRISGQIAENYLTPKARAAVRAILGESVAMASNWADFIKSDTAYNYLYDWHFVDFDRPYSYPEMVEFLEHDNAVDAYTKVKFLIAELKKKNLPKDKKLLYMRVLIHVVEDVHQPFHTGHTEDKGGNSIKLTWFSKNTNLHSIWDSELIDFQQLSYTEYTAAIDKSTVSQRTAWQKAPLTQWIFESHTLAQKLYGQVKNGDTLKVYNYNFDHVAELNKRLQMGGVRLAGLLNQLFG
jgi:hypothetical protein